jgi:glycosyltransferase involved in cell wall biosynthesis
VILESNRDPREWNGETTRVLERASIRLFMERHRDKLAGRVLDFGSGTQPYRDLVSGEYIPYEKGDAFPDSDSLDAILCNQVLQYLTAPQDTLSRLLSWLKPGGYLVMTYPTNWDEVEEEDLWRFTKAGAEYLLSQAGFHILVHEKRAEINLDGFRFPLGYGVVARRPLIVPKEVTAVVVTRGDVDLTEIKESLACFGEVIIYDNSKCADHQVFGRYVPILDRDGVIYTQDDDCVLDNPAALCGLYEPGTIVCNMPPEHAARYEDKDGIALIGFGAIFDASLAKDSFARYLSQFPQDVLFKRECDRVFTALNRTKWVNLPFRSLAEAEAANRLYRQPEHTESLTAIRKHVRMIKYPHLDIGGATPPVVSAIIIFFNSRRFLREAIDSVLVQTYDRWELLLVDDGSTDGSTEIAQEYCRVYPERIRYFEHPNHENRGKSASRNLGVRHAKGSYVAFLDSDDVWLPHKLNQQVALAEAHPEAVMVCGRSLRWWSWTRRTEDAHKDAPERPIAEADTLVQPPTLVTATLGMNDCWPTPSGSLIRREVLERVGGSDERFRTVYEHGVLFAKLFLAGPVWMSGDYVAHYRQHQEMGTLLATRTGEWTPPLPSLAHHAYLEWLADYLTENRVTDRDLLRRLRKELRPYRFKELWYRAQRLGAFQSRAIETVRNLFRTAQRLVRGKSIGWIRANPNPIVDWPETNVTSISWSSSGTTTVEVRVGSPSGELFSRTASSGEKLTGDWISSDMVFYLQDVSDGLPLAAKNTLATTAIKVFGRVSVADLEGLGLRVRNRRHRHGLSRERKFGHQITSGESKG